MQPAGGRRRAHCEFEPSSSASAAWHRRAMSASWCRKPTSRLVGCTLTSTCAPGSRRSCAAHSRTMQGWPPQPTIMLVAEPGPWPKHMVRSARRCRGMKDAYAHGLAHSHSTARITSASTLPGHSQALCVDGQHSPPVPAAPNQLMTLAGLVALAGGGPEQTPPGTQRAWRPWAARTRTWPPARA